MRTTVIGICLLLVFTSCGKDENFTYVVPSSGEAGSITPQRLPSEETRRVLVYVSAGFNSLSNYLDENLRTLEKSTLPQGTYYSSDVLLVLARKTVGGYSTPSAPVLFRLYADTEGNPVRDTLKVWKPEDPLCSPEVFSDALRFIYGKFPAKGYGLLFSSHALGWLPPNYKASSGNDFWGVSRRSIGQDKTDTESYELSLEDFAEAIPGRLDYILFDCCLTGCVEVAWQLRGKADIVGFSPTEILAVGFDYSSLTTRLFAREPDPVGVCQDYFAQYGPDGDATISVVDTRKMDNLASVCKTLFSKYRDALKNLSTSSVQRYFRASYTPNCTVMYDLKDMLLKAGISQEEEAALDAALSEAILYKDASRKFISIDINTYSGLSVYLPSAGNDVLDKYYKEHVAWNNAVELIQ